MTKLESTALNALEAVVVARARRHGATPEMESAWARYRKVKAATRTAGSPAERRIAVQLALVCAAKMVGLTTKEMR